MARPTMLASASGELKTRAPPNLRCSPQVTLNTPPLPFTSSSVSSRLASATSSPNTTIRGSRSISSRMHELRRSTMVVSSPSNAGESSVSNSLDVGSTSSEYSHFMAVSGAGCACSSARSAASLSSSSTSRSSASSSSAVAIPSSSRYCRKVTSGSRSASASRSAAVLYIRSSSDMEWEYGRITWACSSAGPFRCRAWRITVSAAFRLASTSVPSTSSMSRSGNPLTSRLTLPPAVPTSTGTEMAYPLSSTRKTTGSFRFDAVFSASQNSPSEVCPSPVVQSTTSSSSNASIRSRIPSTNEARNAPSAVPTDCRYWVPVGEDVDTIRRSRRPQCDGICRPPLAGSASAPTACSRCSYGVIPSAWLSARSR